MHCDGTLANATHDLRNEALLAWLCKDELLFHLPARLQVKIVIVYRHLLQQLLVTLEHKVVPAEMLEDVIINLVLL